MAGEPTTAVVEVPTTRASAALTARAALELTASCWVWLERTPAGVSVSLEERVAHGEDLATRFQAELDRLLLLRRIERETRLVRSAVIGQALGPAPRAQTLQPPAPTLDPETEAEIEKLLAEIESDDWLDDASEIAKTWEERFGADPDPGNDDEEKK